MDLNRRDALSAVLALLAAGTNLDAQDRTAQSGAPPPVFQHDLPNISLNGWEVRVSHVDYPPGRVGQPHHHEGFLFAYVVQGAVVAQIVGDGVSKEERTYRAGEMFYEPIGSTHQVAKNASSTEPARLLAINFLKKGE